MFAALRNTLAVAALAFAAQASAQVVFYEFEGFAGRSFTVDRPVIDFNQYGFNDRSSSVVVLANCWEVCTDAGHSGTCMVLKPGRYASLADLGMNDLISSTRIVAAAIRVDPVRMAPPPPEPVYDNRRRRGERLFEAPITSARVVYGPREQRCWVQRDHRRSRDGHMDGRQHNDPNYNSGSVQQQVLGAGLGSVLGHQAGPARRSQEVKTRCAEVDNGAPQAYYDVTYNFRGIEHRLQMVSPPGPSITVNRQGEPRAAQ